MKMPLKFAANISMLFQEIPSLLGRFKAAKDAGFKYTECTFPYSEGPEELEKACKEAGVEHVLINSWPGKMEKGELGLAALPDRVQDFRMQLELSIEYANCLNCKRMHVTAGRTSRYKLEEMETTYLENLRFAADRLQKEGIMCLIEPLNSRITAPNYFLNNLQKGVDYIKKINHPNLKLQFDVFHAQIISGDLTGNLKKFLPYIGHIQIAQVPDRGEPDLQGEVNYKYIFQLLEDIGYDGFIGLEYKPRTTTTEGLKWMKEIGVSPSCEETKK
ncbi:putative hydroxypyruvate isomerase [Mercenaria mercenaria]|uniref:putative hydroxypyruvate isomerase n=1 Tax=Mercenaria mercenaria TaxID=6596 RepID=UPI001E1DD719|nr:putative hydroxypyruvate isomerase [Mercenaria mercenaria]